MRKVQVWLGGVLFAVLQFSYFLLLEWQLSSTWTTYAVVTLGWMTGVLAGLRLRARGDKAGAALLSGSLCGYYLLRWMLDRWPFWDRLLPVYALLVALSGAHCGFFFRASFSRLGDARALLLHENNGFVAGLIISFVGFFCYGDRFVLWAPLALGLSLLGLGSFAR